MIDFEEGKKLAAIGFVTPVPLPSFVIPVFAEWQRDSRLEGVVGREELYLQDKVLTSTTQFSRIRIDSFTRVVRLRQREVRILVQNQPSPQNVTIQDDDFYSLIGRGERLYAFANEEGSVYAGHRQWLAPFLLREFGGEMRRPRIREGDTDVRRRFLNRELFSFAREFQGENVRQIMLEVIMGRLESRVESRGEYQRVLERVETFQELQFAEYDSDRGQ